jgi:uncharacterized protein YdeI (YjbR/CyaY-like superfamily)
MDVRQDLPVIAFASPPEWEAWLEANHATSKGLWLKIAKKGAGVETVTYDQALEAALCYGWIDGQKNTFDDRFWLQRFTPRGPRSKWSRVNRDKASELLRRGKLKPAGMAEVERAQRDGRWEAAYEAQSSSTVPEDLRVALDQHPKAKAFFATLDRANRYAILYRLGDAKRPETRARRLAQYVAMLEEGRKLHP